MSEFNISRTINRDVELLTEQLSQLESLNNLSINQLYQVVKLYILCKEYISEIDGLLK